MQVLSTKIEGMLMEYIRKQMVFLFIFVLSGVTQNVWPIYFKHIGIKEGLSQTSVMSIYQDEFGRMWFGTEEGISVYNGKDVVAFKHSEDSLISRNALIGNMSFPITGDRNGNIYFRSDNKLLHYDIKNEQFSLLKSDNVTTVYCKDGDVYVAASDTIYIWDNEDKAFNVFLKTNLTPNYIQKIFIDSKKCLWVGTFDGLYMYNENNEPVQFVKDEYVYEIFEDSKSNIWIATRYSGMYKYTPQGIFTKFKHNPDSPNSIPHNQIRSFAEDNYGNIWIGTFRGLCKYNPATDVYTVYQKDNLPGALNHSSVFSTYKDDQGTIWAGTYYGGIHYFNPETDCFSLYSADIRRNDCLSHFFVGKMAEDKTGGLWICTEGGGLNHFDRKSKTFRHLLADGNKNSISHNNLKCITYSEKYDKLYIGTHTGGVSIYDIKNDTFHNFRDENPDIHREVGNIIVNLKIYKEDILIIHSSKSIFQFDLITKELSPIINNSTVDIYSGVIIIDSDDYLWMENESEIIKVSMKDNSDVTYYNKTENGFGMFRVSCIFEDTGGKLFFGTFGSGLHQYDKDTDRFIIYKTEQNMLLSNYCYEIAQTGQNEIIISGDKGLSILNTERKTLRSIGLSTLLLSGINRGNGLFVCHNGEIFTGGINGMTSFFEQEAFSINKDYALYFSSLSVNDVTISPNDKTRILKQALPYTKKIVLSHKQNNLNISFTSNNYINKHEDIKYEHKLEGFNDKWISDNNIIYTNISPGNYKLTVREKNPKDGATPKTISMDITVRYAWYANPVAYIIYVAFAYITTIFFLRLRNIRIHLRTSLKAEREEKAHIEKLNQAKLQFFANISHEFHTPLTLIIVQIERLLNSSTLSPFVYNKLLKVNKQATHLQHLISELLDFRKLEQGHVKLKVQELDIISFVKEIYYSFHELSSTHNIKYIFNAPDTEKILCMFDPKQMQKVFYNLISNAFKYTRANGSIEILISSESDSVVVKVIDNGIGIEKEDLKRVFECFYQSDNAQSGITKSPSAGIGLSVVNSIMNLHHGTISVESKPSYGSIFSVVLQKGCNHFTDDEIDTCASQDYLNCSTEIHADSLTEVHTDILAVNECEENKSTILIVEDNNELLLILTDIFSSSYNTLIAHNGKEGVEVARREKPDLIISDIMMPEMSGTEMCVVIKNDFEICHIPVILLTALSSIEHSIYGLQHGADDYISKPFNEKVLIARCNNLIRNRMIIKNKFNRNLEFDVQSISNNPIDQKFLDTINRVIENNFDNPAFNINNLASEINISRSSLYSKFESLTGMTPNDYVLQRKLKKASILLLTNTNINVSEISDMLGFGSARYFSRCFKNKFGMSPVEYRKTQAFDTPSESSFFSKPILELASD